MGHVDQHTNIQKSCFTKRSNKKFDSQIPANTFR